MTLNYYFITGTSRGIGEALAKELLIDKKNYVLGFSRNQSIEESNYSHKHIDLSNIESITNFDFPNVPNAESICLVNNAGTLGDIKYFGNLSDENLAHTMVTNFVAPIVLSNKFMRKYKDVANRKTIINLGSGASKTAYDGWGAYCASKAGLEMITKVIAKEQDLVNTGFEIYNIAPGVVDTKMQESIRESNPDDFSHLDKFLELKKENGLYQAEDVAVKLVELMQHPELIEELSYRIVL
jgi:benzil reductase ((S)-benzoin forming)